MKEEASLEKVLFPIPNFGRDKIQKPETEA